MATKIKTNDIRKFTIPTFEDIEVGSVFTENNGETIFIKLDEVQIHYYCSVNEDKIYNAISLNGDFETFSDDEEVQPIQEIEITIK